MFPYFHGYWLIFAFSISLFHLGFKYSKLARTGKGESSIVFDVGLIPNIRRSVVACGQSFMNRDRSYCLCDLLYSTGKQGYSNPGNGMCNLGSVSVVLHFGLGVH